MFEHIFDKRCEFPGSRFYCGIASTDLQLVRDAPLNGGKAKIEDVVGIFNDPMSLVDNIRLSSDKQWICQDRYHFVIHNGYCRPFLQSQEQLVSCMLERFEVYRSIDVFMYYSD